MPILKIGNCCLITDGDASISCGDVECKEDVSHETTEPASVSNLKPSADQNTTVEEVIDGSYIVVQIQEEEICGDARVTVTDEKGQMTADKSLDITMDTTVVHERVQKQGNHENTAKTQQSQRESSQLPHSTEDESGESISTSESQSGGDQNQLEGVKTNDKSSARKEVDVSKGRTTSVNKPSDSQTLDSSQVLAKSGDLQIEQISRDDCQSDQQKVEKEASGDRKKDSADLEVTTVSDRRNEKTANKLTASETKATELQLSEIVPLKEHATVDKGQHREGPIENKEGTENSVKLRKDQRNSNEGSLDNTETPKRDSIYDESPGATKKRKTAQSVSPPQQSGVYEDAAQSNACCDVLLDGKQKLGHDKVDDVDIAGRESIYDDKPDAGKEDVTEHQPLFTTTAQSYADVTKAGSQCVFGGAKAETERDSCNNNSKVIFMLRHFSVARHIKLPLSFHPSVMPSVRNLLSPIPP